MSTDSSESCPFFLKDSAENSNIFLEKEFFQFLHFNEPEDLSLWAVKFPDPQGIHIILL